MVTYHVRFTCAPDYMARRLPFRPAHLEQLVRLRDKGVVIAGGPEPDGTAAHIFYRVADRAELEHVLEENVFNRAGLFSANHPRSFTYFLEPIVRTPVDMGLAAVIVEGLPANLAQARLGLTALQEQTRVAFGGFFIDGSGLAVVRSASLDDAVAWLAETGGWERANLRAHAWSQTL